MEKGPAGRTRWASRKRRDTAYWFVIETSSTAASTRLAPEASAASKMILMVWPAKELTLTLAGVHTASRSDAAPSDSNTVVVPEESEIRARKKSALEEFERWAR